MRVFVLLVLALTLTSCGGKKPVVQQTDEFIPERSFERANKLIEEKEYEEARQLLFEIKNRDLTKKYGPLAQLRIADVYVREGEPDLAVNEYRRFLEFYPDHQHAPYAQYQVAMVYFNQIEGPERGYGGAARAMAEFERLKKMYPRNPYNEVIDLRIQKCRNVIAEYEYLVGNFYLKKGVSQAAITRFEGVLKEFPDYTGLDEVMFALAKAYRLKGENEKAEAMLNELIEKYPKSLHSNEAKKELASLHKPKK